MRMMTRIKTTVPPPIYIAGTRFYAQSRVLDRRLVDGGALLLLLQLVAISSAFVGRRYFESSWTELEFPAESVT